MCKGDYCLNKLTFGFKHYSTETTPLEVIYAVCSRDSLLSVLIIFFSKTFQKQIVIE